MDTQKPIDGWRDLVNWAKAQLLEFLPDWADPLVASLPEWLVALLTIVIVFLVGGLAIKKLVGVFKDALAGYRLSAKGAQRIFELLFPRRAEGIVDQEAEAEGRSAVEKLVMDKSRPARRAARELAQGNIKGGFTALETRARAAEGEAAEYWKQLGALAYEVDTARAVQAYENAFRLDPSDFWTCVFLARLRQTAGDLPAARAAAEAAEHAAQSDRDRSVAFDELGNVLVQAGDLDGAKKQYQESLNVAERLAKNNPTSAEAQRDLSISLNKLGDVLVQAGDLDGALKHYQDCHDVLERLNTNNPTSAQAQRDVWVSMWKLASLEGGGVAWTEVVEKLEAMQAAGTLFPVDEPYLEQARVNSGL